MKTPNGPIVLLASIISLASAMGLAAKAASASAASISSRYCRPSQTDARERPIPNSLVPLVRKTFGYPAPQGGSFMRCAHGRLLVCTIGANEVCGKADLRRVLPGTSQYCRSNAGSAFIPMVVTGHATVYTWRCVGATPTPGAPIAKVDRQGFFVRTWKTAE